jgi:hypothetical protein
MNYRWKIISNTSGPESCKLLMSVTGGQEQEDIWSEEKTSDMNAGDK